MTVQIEKMIDALMPPRDPAVLDDVVAMMLNAAGGNAERALKGVCSVALDRAIRLEVAMHIAEQYLPKQKRVGRPPNPRGGVYIPTNCRRIFRKHIGAPKKHDLPLSTREIAMNAAELLRECPGATVKQAAKYEIVRLGGIPEPRLVANVQRRVSEILRRNRFP